jgi:hypothetical protein
MGDRKTAKPTEACDMGDLDAPQPSSDQGGPEPSLADLTATIAGHTDSLIRVARDLGVAVRMLAIHLQTKPGRNYPRLAREPEDERLAGLTPCTRQVYATLGPNVPGQVCGLAKALGMHRDTVRVALQALEERALARRQEKDWYRT